MATMKKACDGRRMQIVLLDDRRLDIAVQARLTVAELLSIVASHCALKDPDRQYFGLAYIDDKDQMFWLSNERRVLDHEFPRKTSSVNCAFILHHRVKFFVDSFLRLTHASAVELLFLQVRSLIHKGIISVDHEMLFQLGALATQVACGDFIDECAARRGIKKLPIFPESLLKFYYSPSECEDAVIALYRNLVGLSRGNAIVKYLHIVERLETYGMHFYDVKDKSGSPYILGISCRGIFQFKPTERTAPLRCFGWNQLENLYYRDKRFSIEVHDSRRVAQACNVVDLAASDDRPVEGHKLLTSGVRDPVTEVSLGRRTFVPSNVHVLVFVCDSPLLCKNLWSLAITQHEFYLDTRMLTGKDKSSQVKLTNTVLDRLNHFPLTSGQAEVSNNSTSDLGSSVSSQSLRSLPNLCCADEEFAKESEYYKQLQSKRQNLEALLKNKQEELKCICVQEGNITGQMPNELYRALQPGEEEPKIRRRVGTSFCIGSELVNKLLTIDRMSQLEADIEVKRKIVAGHQKLANDTSISSVVRRRRRQDLKQAMLQLRQAESQLQELTLHRAATYRSGSEPNCIDYVQSPFKGSRMLLSRLGRTDYANSTQPSSHDADCAGQSTSRLENARYAGMNPSPHAVRSASIPNSPSISSRSAVQTSGIGWRQASAVGYRPFAPYQSAYRQQNFPTLINKSANERGGHLMPALNAALSLSSHSLHSVASSSAVDERDAVGPLLLFAKNSPDNGDHQIGSYNVPQQRTSWDYECLEQMNRPALGSSESVNSGLALHGLPPMPAMGCSVVKNARGRMSMGTAKYVGSLDRRYLKLRSIEREGLTNSQARSRDEQQPIETLERSPLRPPTSQMPTANRIETSKPYRTEDFLRYTTRMPNGLPTAGCPGRSNVMMRGQRPLAAVGDPFRSRPEAGRRSPSAGQAISAQQRPHCQKVMSTHDVQDVLSWYDNEATGSSSSPLKAGTVV